MSDTEHRKKGDRSNLHCFVTCTDVHKENSDLKLPGSKYSLNSYIFSTRTVTYYSDTDKGFLLL